MNLSNKTSKLQYITLGLSGLLLFLLIWSLLSYAGIIAHIFLPTPTSVVSAVSTLFISGHLFADILVSASRILLGLLCSLIVAVPVGFALGLSRKFEAFAEPLIAFIRYIPPSAFIPLAIIWFGFGEIEKTIILFLGIAPYLALLIADVVASTQHELIETALTLGANHINIITKVIFPNALPAIWDSFRIMVGAAWTFVIIAEIVGASSGLGHLMVQAQRFLRTDSIFAGIVIIGLLGLMTDYFFKITYKIFFPWTEKSSNA